MFDAELLARFEAKVDRSAGPDGCHIWTGARIPRGYGSLGSVEVDGVRRSQVGAHRIAFAIEHGYWPKLTRHTCDNPPCVNPTHLLDGDTKLNAKDMVERGRCPATQRTHCPQGHLYSPENTWISKQGHRKCRECARASGRRQYAKHAHPRGPHPATLRTHCPKGHPYDMGNVYWTKEGHRKCKVCQRANAKRQAEKRRARDPEGFRRAATERRRRWVAQKTALPAE